MCTRSCALDPNRNALKQTAIQNEMEQCLGARQIIWLTGNAIVGDDTDGHIDQLARFAPGNRILVATAPTSDVQHHALNVNRSDLMIELERLELSFELTELPVPDPVVVNGHRLPASYCNFYVTNGSVIVPQFGVPQDESALSIVGDCFPGRKTLGLPSLNLSVGLGSFHCLTQQIPVSSGVMPELENESNNV